MEKRLTGKQTGERQRESLAKLLTVGRADIDHFKLCHDIMQNHS